MAASAIFIHGILRRSGTNFLNKLLLLHPDVEETSLKIRENWFLHHSDYLKQYFSELNHLWSNSKWGGSDYSINNLYRSIGDAQINYLKTGLVDHKGAMLSKTPDVKNLILFHKFFPFHKLIIIVRNPFDIAASSYNTWGYSPKKIISDWNQGVRDIYEFERITDESKYLLLRYEDILENPEAEISKCLRYLDLDSGSYKWDEVDKLPVFFSSESGDAFKVVDKASEFNSINRWKKLPFAQLQDLKESSIGLFGEYLGYTENGELHKLPNYESRLIIGKKTKQQNVEELNINSTPIKSRKDHLKSGVKSLIKVVTG